MDCAVIGIGKLGLCFALYLEKMGARVIGVDVNEDYVNKINSKTLFSHEPGLMEALQGAARFEATTDMDYAVKNLFLFLSRPLRLSTAMTILSWRVSSGR